MSTSSHLAPEPDPTWLDRARVALEGERTLWVEGPPGPGRRGALRALAARAGGTVIQVWLGGCEEAEDVLRAVGEALALAPRGDPGAIGARLGVLPAPLLVLDEAGAAPAAQALSTLRALAPGARFLLGGFDARGLLPHLRAPREARPSLSGPPAAMGSPAARRLAVAPRGLPPAECAGLPPDWLLDLGERRVMRPELAMRLERPDPAGAAVLLAPLASPWLGLAEGRAGARLDTEADLLLLRWVARHHPEAPLRARAAAAAARLVAAAGQVAAARELLAREATRSAGLEAALLAWADGDLLLDLGLLAEATARHRAASDTFEAEGAAGLKAGLLTATAGRLLTLGFADEARRRAREAQRVALRAGDRGAAVAPLRLIAELAALNGEVVTAEALHDQAEEAARRAEVDDQIALALSRAGLAAARGELGAARALLEGLDADNLPPAVGAAVARRRCDVLLRQGAQAEVLELIDPVVQRLRRLGLRAQAAAAQRLRADALALAGHLPEAADAYALALDEAARAADLHGARRTLTHLLALERAGGDQRRIDELLALLTELDTELGDPGRLDAVGLTPLPSATPREREPGPFARG